MIFRPKYVFKTICDITPDFIKKEGIEGIILDLDNTLTTHNNPNPDEKIMEWLESTKKNGVKLIIVSNNRYERVKPFSEILGIDFVPNGRKPLPSGMNRAVEKLGLDKKNVASVGDQIFTDVMGANFAKVKSIFVFPIEPETGFWFRVKRTLEKPLLPKKVM